MNGDAVVIEQSDKVAATLFPTAKTIGRCSHCRDTLIPSPKIPDYALKTGLQFMEPPCNNKAVLVSQLLL